MLVGDTLKGVFPIELPPVGVVNTSYVAEPEPLPVMVDEDPEQIVAGDAEDVVGLGGGVQTTSAQ